MIPARKIFESISTYTASSPPPDPIDAAQVRLAAWEARQPFYAVSSLPVTLGIGEECGELADAANGDDTIDAAGDIAVYVCQVATRHRLAMRGILVLSRACLREWTTFGRVDPWRYLLSALGVVNHMILKREQRIREGTLPDEEFRELLCTRLADLIAAVEAVSARSMKMVFMHVATKILDRDWQSDPMRGGDAAP